MSLVLRIAKIVLVVAAVEALFWLFGWISIHRGNAYRLYDRAQLAEQIAANLPAERDAPKSGWGAAIARPHPALGMSRCGSAWGGSFTLNAEIGEPDTWPYLASIKLGCEIDNFGVEGFGFDQTLVLFREHPVRHSLVILGMAEPMISVGGAASWAFLDLRDHLPQWKLTKPFFKLQRDALQLVPRPAPTVDAILDHDVNDDYARSWTTWRFPFSLSVARAIFRRRSAPDLMRFSPMDNLPELAAQRKVAGATIAAMARSALENDDHFAVLLIPKPEDSLKPDPVFVAMLKNLADQAPRACLIDPSPELEHAASALPVPGNIMTATGHFGIEGNAALSDALVRGLSDCGMKP
jgi:hypothetical protein